MGVTVYLFDSHKSVRVVLARSVSELLHTEEDWLLDAKIPVKYGAEPGEYLGFMCVDQKFRLFEIDEAADDSDTGTTVISATDAGAAELNARIAPETRLENKGAAEVLAAVLAGSGWAVGEVTATERTASVEYYYKKVWACLEDMKAAYNARIIPYYTFDGKTLTGKKVDVLARTPVFRGRVFQGRSDAEDVSISLSGSPRTVMYGLGKTTGTGSTPERLTIADAEWSKANGDPADKPKGQAWIADAEAVAKYGEKAEIYEDSNETDAAALLKKAWEYLQLKKQPTVEGTATAQNLEMLPGHEWQQVRLYDQVGVVDRRGTAFLTQVIGIERDYIRPWLTKFDLGDEKQEDEKSLAEKVKDMTSELSSVGGRAGGAGNKGDANRELILENYEQIKLHTLNIGEMAGQIREAQINIENGSVQISGLEKTVTSQGERLRQAEIDVDGAKAAITLKADQTTVSNLGERVTSAEISIDGAWGEIGLKVSKDGVISAINLTSEAATIQASKINLQGYVTASQLSAEVADINKFFAGTAQASRMDINSLTSQTAQITNVSLINYDCAWKSKTVVTGVTINTTSKYGVWQQSSGTWTGSLLQSAELKVSKSTINYMGRAID